MNAVQVSAYFDRIRYSGSREPTPETLRLLQRAHLYSVPFENLDIHLGRPIRLEEEALFDKIVMARRGGFCYELNGLFSLLLTSLGYQVTLLNARGVNDDGAYSIDFDHLALLVRCPSDPQTPWLVDIGWGNGPLEPLRLVEGFEQRQEERVFKLVPSGDYKVLLEQGFRDEQPAWINHYAFQLVPHVYPDFFPTCRYHSTSPESMFTRKRLCTLYLPDGRATFSEQRLIITRGGAREERELNGEAEIRQVLSETFGVNL